MRYKELPKKWKVIAALLIIVNILLIVADTDRFIVMGYGAGAFYAAETVRMLNKYGFAVDSLRYTAGDNS